MKIDSPHWNDETGVCLKHGMPGLSLPCICCLNEKDPDIEVRIEEIDRVTAAMDPEFDIKKMLPMKHADWLVHRIVN